MIDWPVIITLLHAAATWFMVGLIWFVQVVHYPNFAHVPAPDFTTYAGQHTLRTGWVVGPPMLIEAACATYLAVFKASALSWSAFSLLLVVWASTAFLQVPAHNQLAKHYNASVIRRLVRTNWIRTLGWSGRGVLALMMLLG